jgi:prepilin-type processing-associated H-X9-DG protein
MSPEQNLLFFAGLIPLERLLLAGIPVLLCLLWSRRRWGEPQTRARRAAFKGLIWLAAVVTIVGSVGFLAAFGKVFAAASVVSRRAECQRRMTKLATALGQYAADWSGALPPPAIWGDVVVPYLAAEELPHVFRCPAGRSPFGYALNSGLKRLDEDGLAGRILLFECDARHRNEAGDPGARVVPDRHVGVSNCGWADGHVKWVRGNSPAEWKRNADNAP